MKFIIECITHNGGNSLFEAMVNQEKDFRHSFDISKKNTLYSIQYKDGEIEEATDTNINAKFEELSSGGIITFSTDVNSVTLSNDRFKNFLKKKFVTYGNRLKKNSLLDKIRRKHVVYAWTVGNYLNGVYTGEDGKTYNENSLSITMRGLNIDDIVEITKDICEVFTQESVMVDDCENHKTYIIYAEKKTLECNRYNDGAGFINEERYLTLDESGNIVERISQSTNNYISEASVVRTLEFIRGKKSFCVITAFRKGFDLKQNMNRNNKLLQILNKHKMGPHVLLGHWLEATDEQIEKYGNYESVPKDELKDTVERSFLVPKPEKMGILEFIEIMYGSMTIDGKSQDGVVFGFIEDDVNVMNSDETIKKMFDDEYKAGYYYGYIDDGLKLGFIGSKADKKSLEEIKELQNSDNYQGHSTIVKRNGRQNDNSFSFVFEGFESPASQSGVRFFKMHNLHY